MRCCAGGFGRAIYGMGVLLLHFVTPRMAMAQRSDDGMVTILSAGIAGVHSRQRYMGTASAGHVGVSIGHSLGERARAALVFDAFVMGPVESIPGCVPSPSPCSARTERPGLLGGLSIEATFLPGLRGLALTGGTGVYGAPNVKGPVSGMSGAFSAGLHYELLPSGAFSPLIGFRFTHMTSDVAGITWMAAPHVGLRF